MNGLIVQSAGEGRLRLEAIAVPAGDGLSVTLTGGDAPHIGAVAVSQPRPSLSGDGTPSCTTSVFNMLSHKDDALAVPLAERLCRRFQRPVVVCAGVHLNAASAAEIERFRFLLDKLAARLEAQLDGELHA